MTFSRQCLLTRGSESQVSWIPEEYAKKGKFIKLWERNDWEDGWRIEQVGGRKTTADANRDSQDYKRLGKMERKRK